MKTKQDNFPEYFSVYIDKLYEIYQTKGKFFGEGDKFKGNFYLAASHALLDIAKYAQDYKINITELDAIKLFVFIIPHLYKENPNIIIERLIRSIFTYLEEIYGREFDRQELDKSAKVCVNFIEKGDIVSVYTYIKGVQEGVKA
ncbi:hypothetical protein SPONL_442 [uncultured Candidatus Thioglobus sp.]|nr:hypothetical protein SPONL_442 [uncultured Candidatus Thioglobus sp.]